MIIVGPGRALTAVRAWFRDAVVHFILTHSPDVTWHALTAKAVHLIHAGGTVQARIPLAVVHIDLAAFASEADRASTLVAIEQIFTRAIVHAGIRLALVGLLLAIGAGVAGRTVAHVAAYRIIFTGRTVLAGRVPARSRRDLAGPTAPTRRTGATIAMMLPGGQLAAGGAVGVASGRLQRAGTAVLAGLRVTVEEWCLAVGAGEVWRARAGV